MSRFALLITCLIIAISNHACSGDSTTQVQPFEDDAETCMDLLPEHHTHDAGPRKRRHVGDDGHGDDDHTHIEPSTEPPYFSISAVHSDQDDQSTVTIKPITDNCPTTDCKFKNFLVVARENGSNSMTNYGTFTPVTDTKTICEGKALTLSQVKDVANTTFVWKPSSDNVNIYIFKATVVYNYTTFFTIESNPVHVHTVQLFTDEAETCKDLLPEHHDHDHDHDHTHTQRKRRHIPGHDEDDHSHIHPSTEDPYFSISVSPTSVKEDDEVEVTIKPITDNCPTTDCKFKNFLVVARENGSNSMTNYGTFTPVTDTKTICSGDGFTSKVVKGMSQMKFKWTAPNVDGEKHYVFKASVVYSYEDYFVIESPVVTVDVSAAFAALPSLVLVVLMTMASAFTWSL